MAVVPDDVTEAAASVTTALARLTDQDWSVPAGAVDLSCRDTLDHLPDALLTYAGHLATRATAAMGKPRQGDPAISNRRLLLVLGQAAAVLADVARAAPAGTRAFHVAGMSDAEGFCAMGCDELLVHGKDIAVGLGVAFEPPPGLAAQVLARLFPWAPTDVDPWVALLWANGRTALPGLGQLDPDWSWQAAPLEEWDGTRLRRPWPPERS